MNILKQRLTQQKTTPRLHFESYACHRQSGVALLVVMMTLLSGSVFLLVNSQRAHVDKDRLDALLSAKQALIAYAVSYADNYGHNTRGGTGRLPCPSLTHHGSPARSCGANAIGYLPAVWMRNGRLMEIDYLERFLDQDIWYAVSADHRFNPAFNELNSNRGNNLLSVDSMSDVVAVLVAPGSPVNNQHRNINTGQSPTASINHYLEGENADVDSEFTITGMNDLLVPIRRADLLPLMERRVLGFVKEWLIEYKQEHGFYPYASVPGADGECQAGLNRGLLAAEAGSCAEASFTDGAYSSLPRGRLLRQTWFYRSRWPGFIYYIVDDTCTAEYGLTDCDGTDDPPRELTVNGEQVEVVLISVGQPIDTAPAAGMQIHGNAELYNYLDSTALLTGGVVNFNLPLPATDSNDQLVYIN